MNIITINRNAKNYLLLAMVFGLSLLSIKAQFYFYATIFGLVSAIWASILFEILRISTLFFVFIKKKIWSVILYTIIVLFFGSVATVSWFGEIIEANKQRRTKVLIEQQHWISQIKKTYSENAQKEIDSVDDKINTANVRLAQNPNDEYWQKRKEQRETEKENLIQKRDKFLSEDISDYSKWIEQNAALQGMDMESIRIKDELNSIEQALIEIWKIDIQQTRKIVAIVFVSAIEIGIVLLAGLTEKKNRRIGRPSKKKKTKLEW